MHVRKFTVPGQSLTGAKYQINLHVHRLIQ